MTWIEDIEDLTNATDHLEYTNRLILRSEIKLQMRKRLLNELEIVRKRVEDEDLYIAVVGRASSGKSTLINALLGDVLLKSGVLHMTTAAATFVRYGPEITVEVRFHDIGAIRTARLGQNDNLYSSNTEILPSNVELSQTRIWKLTPANEPITESSLPGVENLSIRELIRHLTTTNEIAEKIASITVTHPSEFLKSGLVIIDTPGADAQNQTHKEVTRCAVAQADAAIIITPGEQTVTRWLLDVMEESDFLQPFLHRCVFLITRMDIARERMRRRGREDAIAIIHNDAIQRLKSGLEKFNLPQNPRIYISAAQAVVDNFSGEEPGVTDSTERVYWQREFINFQKELFEYLVHQRAVTIAESVLRLFDDLFESMETYLSELWVDYNDRRSRLKSIIKDIDSFGKEQKKLCRKQIERTTNKAIDEVELTIDLQRDLVLSDLREAVYGVDSVEGLQSVVKYESKKRLSKSEDKIKKQMKKHTTKIKTEAQSFNSSFEKGFNELYEELSLIGKISYGSEHAILNTSSFDIGASISGNSALDDDNTGNLLGGAFFGGLIGTFIFPALGTTAGAAIGAFIGSLFASSLNERKDSIWNDLQPRIVEYFTSLRLEAHSATKKYGDEINTNIQNRIDSNVKQYHSDVELMRQEQIREQKELEELKSTIEKDLAELKNRRNRVRAQQKRLHQIIKLTVD